MRRIEEEALLEKIGREFSVEALFNREVSPFVSAISFESGEKLMEEGQPPNYLYYLAKGRAKLFLSHENGRVSLIHFLDAPCFIGEMELIGAQEAANGVTAITPCICYAVPFKGCRELLLKDAGFLRRLCLFLGKKALENTCIYSKNQAYPLENRLAGFILMTSAAGVYRERHTEAAEFLGVTYRHFLYVLADFVKRGILEKTRAGYVIKDPEALRKAAAPDQ